MVKKWAGYGEQETLTIQATCDERTSPFQLDLGNTTTAIDFKGRSTTILIDGGSLN